MSYSSLNDAWGTPDISTHFYNNNSESVSERVIEKMTNSSDCDCDQLILQILKCKNCHEKIINLFNLQNQNQNNYFNNLFDNINKIIIQNKDIITLVCIILFIILVFNLINNSLIKS